MEAPKAPVAPVALEALYVAEESYGARPVSGFADAPGRRDDIVAYADDSNLVTIVANIYLYRVLISLDIIYLFSFVDCGLQSPINFILALAFTRPSGIAFLA